MIPQTIDPLADPCALASKWRLDPVLGAKLHELARRTGFPVSIVSGYRSEAEQRRLLAQPDSTAAAVNRSTHTSCPATGADVRPGIAITDYVKAQLGRAGVEAGLRWGGGARVNEGGIPVGNEWMHFDLGPRP